MRTEHGWILSTLLVVALAAGGCPERTETDDDGGGQDTSGDQSALPDGYALWPCTTPGQSCNAHDTCAIDPICGKDKLCRPTSRQNCSDGLECTEDTCKGMGLCDNTPRAGSCALPVQIGGGADGGTPKTEIRCFKKGDKKPDDPCRVCDPDSSKTQWTGANGGSCDDGNLCTKDDYCQNGQCKGTYYGNLCADQWGCTEDLCDGKGGCKGNTLKSDWCLINGTCYKDKTNDPSGACNTCDVTKSQSSWTPITNSCLIGGKCYKDGDKHTGLCAVCDPQTSTSAWTVQGSYCLINDVCKKPKDTDPTGCSECDPTQSKTSWTPLSGLCLINGKCYKNADKHTGGCAECDTTVSTTKWTVKGSYCLINDSCKKPKDKDSTGCGECDPTKDKYGWSAVANTCLIGGKCFSDKTKHSGGCAECDVSVSTSKWSVASGYCLISDACHADKAANTATACLVCAASTSATSWSPATGAKTTTEDFESGSAKGWSITNSDTKVGWNVSSKRPSGGSYALYYGDPAVGNYSTSSGGLSTANNGTAAMPAVTLTSGKKAGLSFMVYMDIESYSSYDQLEVQVNGTKVWDKGTSSMMKIWTPVTIDLSTYAGSSVTITFKFNTVDSVANTTEGIHIDDIIIYDNC